MLFKHADYLRIVSLCTEVSETIARRMEGYRVELPAAEMLQTAAQDWVKAMRLFYSSFAGEDKHGLKSVLFDFCLLNDRFRPLCLRLAVADDSVNEKLRFYKDLMEEIVHRNLCHRGRR